MSDDDRLAELFERALGLPRTRRRGFLEEACAGDTALLEELDALLAWHDTAPDFLDRLGRRALPPALETLAAELDTTRDRVGRFEILGRIGAGGMGEVYRARDVELDREVALKVLPVQLATDAAAIERLRQEARIASSLDHPHIAVVHEIGTVPPTAADPTPRTFIAMAHCGDRTLADELARRGALPLEEALRYGLQLVDALSSAHEAGVVHRDVKPANLVLSDRGDLKLVDFGVATRGATRVGGGTMAYMAPEQLTGAPVDHRADIWAAGVVLREMLAGTRPFDGTRDEADRRALPRGGPPPLREARPDVPERLEQIVRRCLASDPDARHASAAALLTELRTAADARAGDGGVSLVVLPFGDAGGEGVDEALRDGFVTDVIGSLSRVRGLRVLAGSSSRRLDVAGRDAVAVARDLGVRHALEGTLGTEQGGLRVTASLVDARTGVLLRSVSVAGSEETLLAMRREVTRAVAVSLGLAPAPSDRDGTGERDPSAYEAFLRARHEAWRFTEDGARRARRSIEAVLALVGDDELLYATLGQIMAARVENGLARAADVVGDLERYADRIFALDPRSSQGHWLRSWAAFQRGEVHEAIRAGEHAHALEPDNPDALILLGYVYAHAGRNADARALLERALLLDPLNPLTQAVQGFVPVMEGRFRDAVPPYRRATEMDPESPFFPAFLGWALAYAGERDEATRTLHGVADRHPESVFGAYARSLARGLEGRAREALDAVTPQLEAAARESEMFARELAHCHALAGEPQLALDGLERAVDLGMWNLAFLAEHDRLIDDVRREPRFATLLDRVRALLAGGAGTSADRRGGHLP